jgi:phage protein D
MIPDDQKFRTYYAEYNSVRHAAEVAGHEYRHHWAQQRFIDVSGGIAAPHAGGPLYASLQDEEKQRWNRAAQVVNQVVNQELGHGEGREDITATYIGAR